MRPEPSPKIGLGRNRPRLLTAPGAELDRLARARQRLQHRVVPEEELKQQRQVADDLDIDHRRLGDDPVVREPRHADQEAEDGGEEDADRGHQHGVDQSDPEGLPVARLGVVVDQRLVDVEAGGVVPELEAQRDASDPHVLGDVAGRLVKQETDDRDQRHLIEDAAHLRVIQQRSLALLGRRFGSQTRSPRQSPGTRRLVAPRSPSRLDGVAPPTATVPPTPPANLASTSGARTLTGIVTDQ